MKAENKKYNFVYREFLNSGEYHSSANVVAKMTEPEFGESFPNCEFNISDCTRTIFLDMDAYSESDVDNSIYKMNKLIEAATKMKKALIGAKPQVIKLEQEREERRKEREAKEKAKRK